MLVSQILLDLKNVQRFSRVVEHRGNSGSRSMARNGSTAIFFRDTCLFTQNGDQAVIDVFLRDAHTPIQKQKLYRFARLSVQLFQLLLRTYLLPLIDAFTYQSMHSFRIGGICLVDGNIQKTDSVFGEDLARFWDHHVFMLPTD